jgi:hypothetical protein
VLVAVALLRDSYVRELARVTGVPLVSVQRITQSLERDGVIVGRSVGTTRLLSLNPRFHGVAELDALLIKYASGMPDLIESIEAMRRRPRRSGKEL